MRIDQIQYVVTAHRHQSISQAAEVLFVTQPSLSRAITALEKELGIQLFHRTYQGATLTPIGEKLLPHFETILAETKRIDTILAEEQAQDITTTLCISASAILCNNLLPDTIHSFKQIYPNIEIDIREEYDTEIIDAVEQNKADIAFLSISPSMNPKVLSLVDTKDFSRKRLLRSSFVALLSSKSSLANKELLTSEDLESIPLILDKKVKPFAETKIDQHVIYAQDRDARTKMILKNQGYCILSSLEMYNDYYIQEGLMVAIPYIDDVLTNEEMELWIVHNKDELEFYEEDFIDTLRRLLLNVSL